MSKQQVPAPPAGIGDPTTTKGDQIVRGASALARLPIGTDLLGLIADSTQAVGMKWGALYADPNTTAGDIAYRSSQDILQGGSATASQTFQGSPAGAVDGNDGTNWYGNGVNPTLTIDISVAKTATTWRMYLGSGGGQIPNPIYIQGSNDNVTFTTIYTASGLVAGANTGTFSQAYTYRYWRVYGSNGGSNQDFNLFTFSVFGGNPLRLAIGGTAQILTVAGGYPVWANPVVQQPALPLTTTGDLLYYAGTINQSLTGVASCQNTSNAQGTVPASINDGNTGTYFQNGNINTQVTIDMLSAVTIDTVTYTQPYTQASPGSGFCNVWSISYSSDNITYTTALSSHTSNGASAETVSFTAATARYWRFVSGNVINYGYCFISELAFSSSAGSTARLPIGVNGQELGVVAGKPAWVSSKGYSSRSFARASFI